jgi:glycosyltransferase involved in cell wall biosynthesis
MRIGLATLEYPPFFGGGIATYYALLAQGLAQAGNEVYVVTTVAGGAEADEPQCDGIHIVRVPPEQLAAQERRFALLRHTLPETARLLAHAAALTEALADLHHQVSLDLVDSPEVQCLNFLLSDLAGLPQLVTFHGSIRRNSEHEPPECRTPDRLLGEQMELCAIRAADGLIASAPEAQAYWQKLVGQRAHVVLPPFEALAAERQPSGYAAPARYALYVGRLQSLKGVEDLARAFAQIAGRCPDLHLIAVGKNTKTGPGGTSMLSYLQAILGDLWQTRWHWLPALPPPELAWLRRRALLAVCPSRWEAFGYTVPEAMADGLPVIVSDGAGVADLCVDGENVLLFPGGDAAKLAECLERLYGDQLLRAKLIEGGYRLLAGPLHLEQTTRTRLEVYAGLVAGGRRSVSMEHSAPYHQIFDHLAGAGRPHLLQNYRSAELLQELSARARAKFRRWLPSKK